MAKKKKYKIDYKYIFSRNTLLLMFFGVASATVALKGFMIPNQFLSGGVTGISILISEFFNLNIAYPIVLLNIIFLFIGLRKIGLTFVIQSFISITLLSIAIQFVDIKPVTQDKILIALFGGVLSGMGLGLLIRAGGVLDGLEIITLYSTKDSKFSSNEISMLVASMLFLFLGFIYGWDKSMYSIITFFTANRASNYVVNGFEEYTSLTIVSKKYSKIKKIIVKDFGKAISVYKGERGYLPNSFDVKYDCDIIVTVVTRLEINQIKKSIYKIDPNAFMFVQSLKEVKGGIIKKISKHK